jgi:hypothetical protein
MRIELSAPMSDNLKYHIENNILLQDNVFRYGSKAWGELICEVRSLYDQGFVLELDEDEYYMLESDVGEMALYENVEVMLNTPQPIWDTDGLCEVFVKTNNGVERIEFRKTN